MKNTTKLSVPYSILLTLYLLVGFTGWFEFEQEAFQWFYFSVLNVFALITFYLKKEKLPILNFNKPTQYFFFIFCGLIGVSLLSMINAIYVSESLVHISRLTTSLISIFCLANIIKKAPRTYLLLVSKVVLIVLIIDSFKSFQYFVGSYKSPRIADFVGDFKHGYQNINIYTAAIITKAAFLFYLFQEQNKLWKYLSYVGLFMVISALIFSGSRTGILSLSIILSIQIAFLLYKYFKENDKKFLYQISFLSITIISALLLFKNVNRIQPGKQNTLKQIAYFPSQVNNKSNKLKKHSPDFFNKNIKIKTKYSNLSPLEKFIEEKSEGRYQIWETAITLFKEHPLLGVGYGNFKLSTRSEYLRSLKSTDGTFKTAERVHNDFIEKFTETGIFGGLLYLFLFVLLFVTILKSFKKIKKEQHYISILFLCVFIAYFFDAFLNFPLERASLNLAFILISAFILVLLTDTNILENSKAHNKTHFIVFSFIAFLCITSNYLVYKNYHFNHKVGDYLINRKKYKKPLYTFKQLEQKVSLYPTLSHNSIHQRYYPTLLAKEENLPILSINNYINNIPLKSFKDSLLFYEVKSRNFAKDYNKYADSVEYYALLNVKKFPALKSNVITAYKLFKHQKDTIKMLSLLNYITKHNTWDTKSWLKKIDLYYTQNKDLNQVIKIVDTALYVTKKNPKLIEKKKILLKAKKQINSKEGIQNAFKKFSKLFYNKKYDDAENLLLNSIQKFPNEHSFVENLGIVYMSTKEYNKAIDAFSKYLDQSKSQTGKAEFYQAICYQNLKQSDKAKQGFRISRSKKYPPALKLKQNQYQ